MPFASLPDAGNSNTNVSDSDETKWFKRQNLLQASCRLLQNPYLPNVTGLCSRASHLLQWDRHEPSYFEEGWKGEFAKTERRYVIHRKSCNSLSVETKPKEKSVPGCDCPDLLTILSWKIGRPTQLQHEKTINFNKYAISCFSKRKHCRFGGPRQIVNPPPPPPPTHTHTSRGIIEAWWVHVLEVVRKVPGDERSCSLSRPHGSIWTDLLNFVFPFERHKPIKS